MVEQRVPIIYTFDDNWVEAACVCFLSLAKNKNPETLYDFVILHRGLKQSNIKLLQRQLEPYSSIKLIFKQFDASVLDIGQINQRTSGSLITLDCFTRLFLPDLLSEYDKVIFSDVDVLFLQDMKPAFDVDLTDKYVGGVKDVITNQLIYQNKFENFSPEEAGGYIYAGFMVMNLDLMRQHNLKDRFIQEMPKSYRTQDQDIINKVCAGRIAYMHQKYTILSKNTIVKDLPSLSWLALQDEYQEALQDIVILHYAGQFKPWHSKFKQENDIIWWDYYRDSIVMRDEVYQKALWAYRWQRSLLGKFLRYVKGLLRPVANCYFKWKYQKAN